jgi:2,3-bisphosphoglycerate-independent phosphoglycerate mutase
MNKIAGPVVLVILDGWGIAPPSIGNAIELAETPNYDSFIVNYPTFSLQASGESVGLPWGEMGNSQVGHLSLGSGKILYQNLPRITKAISDGSFETNEKFIGAFDHVKKNNSALHIMGLVSDGGVHSYNEHLYALIETAKHYKINKIYIHAFLDGRDTAKNSGLSYIISLQKVIKTLGVGQIITLSGRFYAMDRDNRWDRIEAAYKAMVLGKAKEQFADPLVAISTSYENGIFDEELEPVVISNNAQTPVTINDHDAVIYFNFRSDRAREMTKAFVQSDFKGFVREKTLQDIYFVTMTEYEKELPVQVAFPPEIVSMPLAKVISDNGSKQIHIAETEKYAHVTFFFNGGIEKPFSGEEHVMVSSPKISSYDKQPEMSSYEITKKVVESITSGLYQFILVNYASPDMVAHTGNLKATIKGIEAVDECLGQIAEAVLVKNGVMLITADHGNAEEIIKLRSGEIDKEHSSSPVPLILIGNQWLGQARIAGKSELYIMTPVGVLADVAPTVLTLFGLPVPAEMTGKSLV